MHYNNNEQRREKILEYVEVHPRTKKREVIKFMSSKNAKNMSCLRTTQKLLTELITLGKIKVIKDKPGARDHHLVINDENSFFVLNSEIDRKQKFLNDFTKEVMKKNNLKRFSEDKYFREFIRLIQLEFFRKITSTSFKIQGYIKSAEDREMLNLRLARIVLDSNRLNNIFTHPNEMLDLMEDIENKFRFNDNIMKFYLADLRLL
jgi:hypothetical protein